MELDGRGRCRRLLFRAHVRDYRLVSPLFLAPHLQDFATGAFAVQMWAQRLLPAQQVALLFAAEPAVAAWLAWYFLGETLDAQGWAGSAMILGGVLLGAWATSDISPAPPDSTPAHLEGG